MTRGRSVSLVVAAVLLTGAVAAGSKAWTPADGERRGAAPRPSTAVRDDAARRFLDTYVTDEGRVVRHDHGGDTASEGQAYAMLIAAGIGDRDTFARVWDWTERHLQRPDGLLSWRWKDGRVVDDQPAADADVDAARALVQAAAVFATPEYQDDGRRIAAAVLDHETVVIDARRYLLPGPWAKVAANDGTLPFNPSYLAPRSFEILGWTSMAVPELPTPPTDWATLAEDGQVRARADSTYGYDAARVPIRLAESNDGDERRTAAALWPVIRNHRFTDDHPVGLVAAAAAAHAAGDRTAAQRLFRDASRKDRSAPSYYGAAWVALASLWFDDAW